MGTDGALPAASGRKNGMRWLLTALMAAFIGQSIFFGVHITMDSREYINFGMLVYPLYPWFLALLRAVFGESSYQMITILLQNVFLAWSIFSLLVYLQQELELKQRMVWVLALTFFLSFMIQVVFVTSHFTISNSIMSEGLTIPLYFLMFKHLHRGWNHKNVRDFWMCAFLTFLMISTRGQLDWLLIPLAVLGIRICPLKKAGGENNRSVNALFSIAVAGCVFAAAVLFICTTNLIRNGSFHTTSTSSEVLAGNVFYCSSSEDADVFPEESTDRAAFEAVMDYAESNELTIEYADKSTLYSSFMHFGKTFNLLKGEIQYILKNYTSEDPFAYMMELAMALLWRVRGKLAGHILLNFYAGVICSVAVYRPIFVPFALIFFACCFLGILICRKLQILRKERSLLLMVLVLTFLNCFFVAFGVYAFNRYMFYNTPLLYISAELCAFALIRHLRTAKETGAETNGRPFKE